ncbi:MAG: PLP-dependent aspartate aminotransferase family protein [Pseudomonadota bacterium]
MSRHKWHPQTIAAHAAGRTDRTFGGVVAPISVATTFERGADYQLADETQKSYRRDFNPTVADAEAVVSALEGGAQTIAFASGLSAVTSVMRAASGPVALQRGTYYGTSSAAAFYVERGAKIVEFDPTHLTTLDAVLARDKPALVHIETPSNPLITVVDIKSAADRAHAAGALLAVDGTTATPAIQQPLSLGADLVIHSATKGLAGHSDVLAGTVTVADPDLPIWSTLKSMRVLEGAMLSPWDAFLLVRGMRTLHLRIREMNRSALHIAHVLAGHPGVARVRYPGLQDHPQHAIAAAQMSGGFGSLLSFEVAGGAHEALAVCAGLNLIKRATSLGGVESLIEHRHSIEPASTGVPPALLRLSVGIEAVEDIVADLTDALSAIA